MFFLYNFFSVTESTSVHYSERHASKGIILPYVLLKILYNLHLNGFINHKY